MQPNNTPMEKELPTIAIVYLLFYHNESYIDDMVQALKTVNYPKDKLSLVIVSNAHPEEGSFLHYIEDTVVPLSGKELPEVVVIAHDENLGFAAGNNAGVEWALEHNIDYVFFHNNDGFVGRDAFGPIARHMEANPKVGISQMLMLLHPDTEKVNSAGNSFHYLGFGFCDDYRKDINDLTLPEFKEIPYASGAAFIVRTSTIKELGSWDHDFFLYHEDLEWSLRLRIAGYDIHLVRDSIFYHKYQFSRSSAKFYWMERNRYGVLLMFYRWPTLLILAPMLFIMECGQIIFALKRGWFDERVKVYKYWIKPESWKLWLSKRKKTQSIRTRPDRYLLKYTVPTIQFQEATMDHWLLTYVGNPIMWVYYWIVRAIVRW